MHATARTMDNAGGPRAHDQRHHLHGVQTATDRIPRDQAVIEAMPIPCWETDPSGSRLNVNAAWRQLTGHSENHTIDGWTAGILETDRQHLQSEFTSARQNNAPIDIECRIVAHDGTLRLARMQGLPLPGSENAFASYRGVLVDVTAAHARQADAIARMHEKDVLIKEIHHRVKNNMQIISSVLSLQESAVKDPFDLMLFRESQCRIRTMGLVHEHLYHTKNFAAVDFGAYIRNLADALRAAYAPAEDRCALQVEADDVTLDINSAIPAGLLVHEGLSNAFRHAFPGDRAGLVTVRFSQQPDGIRRLSVADNGVGLPPGLDVVATDSLGFRLMHMLADQLDGNLALVSGDGLTLTLTFGG